MSKVPLKRRYAEVCTEAHASVNRAHFDKEDAVHAENTKHVNGAGGILGDQSSRDRR